MKPLNRLLVIIAVVILTVAWGFIEKSFQDSFEEDRVVDLILKEIPPFKSIDVFSEQEINEQEVLKNQADLYFVHFWGTWCAPCEAEFPELIQLAQKLEQRNIHFVFMAMDDKLELIRPFLKRFPKNLEKMSFLLDNDKQSKSKFGIIKVPETILFNKEGKAIKKFVGPQEWGKEYYFREILNLLGNS